MLTFLSLFLCCLYSSGHTSHEMLPLYVRNTLLEKNGTTPGGDQPAAVMALDRRYTHLMGRPLNRFDPPQGKAAVLMDEIGRPIPRPCSQEEIASTQRKEARRKERRQKARENNPLSEALVRLEFKKLPTLRDLYYSDELACEN